MSAPKEAAIELGKLLGRPQPWTAAQSFFYRALESHPGAAERIRMGPVLLDRLYVEACQGIGQVPRFPTPSGFSIIGLPVEIDYTIEPHGVIFE